jgi:hypothetical protein
LEPLPLNPKAGVPLISKSAASTPATGSLNVTLASVRFVTAAPAAGMRVVITGP